MGARRPSCTVEIHRNLVAHDAGLFRNLAAQRPAVNAGLVGQHAQWRLQCVSEIANLRAGALDDLGVGFKQQVELVRNGLDFHRIGAGNAILLAFADLRELSLERRQWTQAKADLEEDRRHNADAKQTEYRDQRIVERRNLCLQFVEVAGHQKRVELLAAEQGEALLDGTQIVAGLVAHVARHAGSVGAVWNVELAKWQSLVEKRCGRELLVLSVS